MFKQYDSYFYSFYVKMFEHWKEVYKNTKNKEALKRAEELKQLVYKNWLVELEIIDKPVK